MEMREKISQLKKNSVKKMKRKQTLNCNLFSASESSPNQLPLQLTEEINNYVNEVNDF